MSFLECLKGNKSIVKRALIDDNLNLTKIIRKYNVNIFFYTTLNIYNYLTIKRKYMILYKNS